MGKRQVVHYQLEPGVVHFRGIGLDLAELELETRDAGGRRPIRLRGYAALFNSPREIVPGMREVVMPGAFTRTLEEGGFEARGIWGKWDHGRESVDFWGHTRNATGPGSLRLFEDERGLRYEGEPFESAHNAHWLEAIRTRTIAGSSFAFLDRRSTVRHTATESIRELHDVDLVDVSPVKDPAYLDASVQVRSQPPRDARALVEELRAAGLRGAEIEAILDRGLASLRGAHSGPTPRRDALSLRVRELGVAPID